VYLLVEEEEGGYIRRRESGIRVVESYYGEVLRGWVNDPEAGYTHRKGENVDHQTAQIEHQSQSRNLSTNHTSRPRPTTSHMRTPTLVCSRFERARSVQLSIKRPESSVQRRVNRRTNARESTSHPSTAHHTVPDTYVYVGWDGTFCVGGEGKRISVPLVY